MYVGHKTGSLTSKDVGLYEGLIDIKGCWISGQVLDIVDTECQGSLTNNNHNNNNNNNDDDDDDDDENDYNDDDDNNNNVYIQSVPGGMCQTLGECSLS